MEALTYTFTLPATVTSPTLYTPVILPLGPLTIAPLKAASIGVLIPFAIFVLVLFAYKYGVWHENTSSSYEPRPPSAPHGRSRRGYDDTSAATRQGFFAPPQRSYGRLMPTTTSSRPSFFSR